MGRKETRREAIYPTPNQITAWRLSSLEINIWQKLDFPAVCRCSSRDVRGGLRLTGHYKHRPTLSMGMPVSESQISSKRLSWNSFTVPYTRQSRAFLRNAGVVCELANFRNETFSSWDNNVCVAISVLNNKYQNALSIKAWIRHLSERCHHQYRLVSVL